MPDDTNPTNPVADLLARNSAPDLIGGAGMPELTSGPIVANYGVGQPGSKRASGAMIPLFIGAGLLVVSLIAGISLLRSGSPSLNNVMPVVLPLFIAAFIAGPALFRAKQGTLQWQRYAEIHADRVEVTDVSGDGQVKWSEPISAFQDILHGFTWISSGDGEGSGLDLEVVLLRHRDPSKVIYLSGTKKTVMGGMSFSEMVQAGRDGRKADVEAAVGDTRNPQVDAFVAELASRTGLSVTQDF